jgi:hypothetical protein
VSAGPAIPNGPSDPLDLEADELLDDGLLTVNGVNGSTGAYLLPRQTVDELAQLASNQVGEEDAHAADLRLRMRQAEASFAARMGVDERDLAQAGWGVIFARDADPAIREALRPLLDHRRAQAARLKEARYREFVGPDGYRPDESKNEFITRHGSSPGPVDPDQLPYYLLIVGDPESIPFSFQSQLDVAHAVGRIDFERPEQYARYAQSVVEAESGGAALPRRATFFGVRNPGDQATSLSARYLIGPLAQRVAGLRPTWEVQSIDGPAAVKDRLGAQLGGPETPALLFTASHGVGFDNGDPRQLTDQGALLCGDWPGPFGWPAGQPLSRDHYLAAEDVADNASLHGLIAFHFACYGAGTPRFDEYAHRTSRDSPPAEIAPRSFLAGLPKRLLGHPAGGALAVVGHVERTWGCSFLWGGRRVEQINTFEDAMLLLLDGYPLGAALEALNQRYAECSTTLSDLLQKVSFGLDVDAPSLVSLWTANNDARGYAVVGDPAVRLVRATAPAMPITGETAPVVIATETSQPPPPAPHPASPSPSRGQGGDAHLPEAPTPGDDSFPPSDSQEGPPGGGGQGTAGSEQLPYGLLERDELERVRTQLGGALRQLAERLATALAETTTLTVTTYACGDLSRAAGGVDPVEGDKPVAVTRIELLGDVELYVPPQAGAIDAATWARHMDHVRGVQAHRAALLADMAETAAALARLLRPF